MREKQLAHVDGLRALAALFVMLNHAFRFPWPNWPVTKVEMHPNGIMLWATGWMRYGHFAVTVFIGISGYCLAKSLNGVPLSGRNWLVFYGRRAWRILPTYYVALGLSLLLIKCCLGTKDGTMWDACLPVTWEGIKMRLFLLHDTFLVYQINNPLWSIATECRIYLFAPLIVLGLRSANHVWAVCVMVLCTLAYRLSGLPFSNHVTVAYLAVFAMGCCSAVFENRLKVEHLKTIRILWVSLIIGVVAYLLRSPLKPAIWLWLDYPVGAAITLCLCDLALSPNSRLARFLSTRRLVWIGGFSFSLYLMHFPFQALVWRGVITPLHIRHSPQAFGLFVILGFPLIIGASWLFSRLFEQPLVNFKPSLLKYGKSAKPIATD